jgi:hypothetical protein
MKSITKVMDGDINLIIPFGTFKQDVIDEPVDDDRYIVTIVEDSTIARTDLSNMGLVNAWDYYRAAINKHVRAVYAVPSSDSVVLLVENVGFFDGAINISNDLDLPLDEMVEPTDLFSLLISAGRLSERLRKVEEPDDGETESTAV